MDVTLDDLAGCFEGVYPSALATQASDGMPNISYLSHVVQVDDGHLALSNQFFAKTASNIRSDPRATLQLVDPHNGVQYHLALVWQSSADRGSLFDRINGQLTASSAQIGMSDVMRLRSVDIFRVEGIVRVEGDATSDVEADIIVPGMPEFAAFLQRLAGIADPSDLLTDFLRIVRESFGHEHAMVLLSDIGGKTFTAAASMGYGSAAVGAEVPCGVGLIGTAAETGRSMRISDVSRVRRMGRAVADSSQPEAGASREVLLPGLPAALSQIAIPMKVQGEVLGILFVESLQRLAFNEATTSALEIAAQQVAAILALHQQPAEELAEPQAAPVMDRVSDGQTILVEHHAFDQSVFIDRAYVIKGLAGRMLAHMLIRHRDEGRHDFTNRELRLAMAGVLPDFKDNLETRLLLLRRRLDELEMPIRVLHVKRGQLRLEVSGEIALSLEN
jgi:adenylate cyclase